MNSSSLLKTLSLLLWQTGLVLCVSTVPGLEESLLTVTSTNTGSVVDLGDSVVVTRELREAGYHRTLVTTLHLTSAEEGGRLLLAQNITRDMYLDIDQLSSLHSLTGEPQLVVSGHMNTEQPAPLSTHHLALLYPSPNTHQSIVPVHFRYQSPCEGVQYVSVIIPPPSLLLLRSQSGTVTLPCNSSTKLLCGWRGLPYTLGEDCETTMIPCGTKDNALTVVTVTLTTTLLAAVYLCLTIVSSVTHQSIQ